MAMAQRLTGHSDPVRLYIIQLLFFVHPCLCRGSMGMNIAFDVTLKKYRD